MSFRIILSFDSDQPDQLYIEEYAAEGPAEDAAQKLIEDNCADSTTVLRPFATFRPKRIIERVPFTISGDGGQ